MNTNTQYEDWERAVVVEPRLIEALNARAIVVRGVPVTDKHGSKIGFKDASIPIPAIVAIDRVYLHRSPADTVPEIVTLLRYVEMGVVSEVTAKCPPEYVYKAIENARQEYERMLRIRFSLQDPYGKEMKQP